MEVASESIIASGNNSSISAFTLLGSHGESLLKHVSNLSWTSIIITLIVVALSYDQLMYQIRKGSIAGPKYKFYPIIGPFLESLDPKFEEYMAKWKSGPLSCVSIFHKFVVIASTRDLARKIFQSPLYVKPCVVDVAVKILRPSNWVFLDGQAHTDYRKSLNGLFTKKALEIYIPEQELIIDKYIKLFIEKTKDKSTEFFPEFREIMCALSLRTFCGEYITDDQIKNVADNYYKVTAALELVNFPIIIPYTKTWYGQKIADETMNVFADCAQMAKDHIKAGGKPTCVMDEWINLMQEARQKKELDAESKLLVRDFSNREISEAIFTFLFASQDASSSACCWLFQILADRKDVLEKVREEQLRVRNGDPNVPLSGELIDSMKYTECVVKETLRYRPPVLMVPYVVKKSYPLNENYTVPKGAMVIPTVYPALHDPEVYENPDDFIPDRWLDPQSPANMAKKNWLVFGTGPHVCLGQKYVMMLFTSLIGKLLMFADFEHTITPLSEQIKVFATIFPQDDLIMKWRKRDPVTGEVF